MSILGVLVALVAIALVVLVFALCLIHYPILRLLDPLRKPEKRRCNHPPVDTLRIVEKLNHDGVAYYIVEVYLGEGAWGWYLSDRYDTAFDAQEAIAKHREVVSRTLHHQVIGVISQ